jgi:hypothetical protein
MLQPSELALDAAALLVELAEARRLARDEGVQLEATVFARAS